MKNVEQYSGTEIHHFIEILTCTHLNYKMDNSILILSICMELSNRMERVKSTCKSVQISKGIYTL